MDVLGTVVEYRNLESGEHIKRVKEFTNILAEKAAEKYPEYGLTPEKIAVIVAASPLHDIGKIAIKDSGSPPGCRCGRCGRPPHTPPCPKCAPPAPTHGGTAAPPDRSPAPCA